MSNKKRLPIRNHRTGRLAAAIAVCLAMTVAGCSGGDEGKPHDTGGGQSAATTPAPPAPLADAVGDVLSHTPRSYPDDLTVVSDADESAALTTSQLLDNLGNWNPAVRRDAAGALGSRGDEVLPPLTKALESADTNVRAGAATALASFVSHRLRNWQEFYPDATDRAAAEASIRAKFSPLTDVFIKLTKDPDREVRNEAMGALAMVGKDSPEAARAVVALCSDPDVYIASAAIILFEKNFSPNILTRQELLDAIRVAMTSPFPRGKGHAFRIIAKLDDEAQRELIPVYLKHLDWQPMRDTMFGAGGQAEALQLCTKFRVKELVPRIPKLMTKTMRGPGLFEPCLEAVRAFGQDAEPILPELRAYLQQLEEELKAASSRSKPGIQTKTDKLKEAVDYVENL